MEKIIYVSIRSGPYARRPVLSSSARPQWTTRTSAKLGVGVFGDYRSIKCQDAIKKLLQPHYAAGTVPCARMMWANLPGTTHKLDRMRPPKCGGKDMDAPMVRSAAACTGTGVALPLAPAVAPYGVGSLHMHQRSSRRRRHHRHHR